MANISKIALPSGDTYDLKDAVASTRGIEYIRGTWTAASGTWTGVSTDPELYDGKQIILYMPFAGSGNATLNLTMADGSTTGAKDVYFESTTRFTTHKGQNSQLHLIYHTGLKLSNGTTYEGWWYVANRDTNDVGYQNRIYYTSSVAAAAIYRYQFLLRTRDGKLLPVSSANNTFTIGKTYSSIAFDPFAEMYMYQSTSTANANANVANNVLYRQVLADLRYAFDLNASATYKLTARQPVYLTATPQADGTAILTKPTGSTIGPLAQTLPSSADGLIYIYLGQAYEDTYPYRLELVHAHPIYWYKNGAVRRYTSHDNASTSVYGVTKLNTATNSTSTTEAATPSAVKTAYDLANTANGTANSALSGVNGTLIYDHTYTISNGVATFTAHVYQKGTEVTSSYADSCFTWSYRLDSNVTATPTTVSLGTGKTKTITISTLGYGGHVIGTFTPPS